MMGPVLQMALRNRVEAALLLAHLEQLSCPRPPDPTGQELVVVVVPALLHRRILADHNSRQMTAGP